MRRHLLGFALFNLIVGTALLVAIFTKSLPNPRTTYVYEVSRTSCWRGVRQNDEMPKTYENTNDSVRVTQAVLNEKTGKLNMSFSVQRETPVTLKLTFVNTTKGNRNWDDEARTEFVTLSPDDFNIENKGDYSIPLSYDWLNDFGKKENLYVKAEIESGSSTVLKTLARGNTSNEFTPVLLMNKK